MFINFLLMFLVSLTVIYLLVSTILKKKIIKRDLYVCGIFTLGVLILSITGYIGYSINDTLSSPVKLSRERISYVNYQDSVITDSTLYSIIQNLRIPHGKIVFAQAKLESDKYKSELFRSNFNLFGMKYATKRPSVTYYENLGYQKYDNWKESVVDYLIWQYSNGVEKFSDEKYFEYLHAYYAEDPSYIRKLKNIIENTNFQKLAK